MPQKSVELPGSYGTIFIKPGQLFAHKASLALAKQGKSSVTLFCPDSIKEAHGIIGGYFDEKYVEMIPLKKTERKRQIKLTKLAIETLDEAMREIGFGNTKSAQGKIATAIAILNNLQGE